MLDQYEIDYVEPTPMVIPKAKKFNSIVTEYDEQYCEEIIRHCIEGGSVESFPGKEYICPDTYDGLVR